MRAAGIVFFAVVMAILGVIAHLLTLGYQSADRAATVAASNLTHTIGANIEESLRRAEADLGVITYVLRAEDLTGTPSGQRRAEVSALMAHNLIGFPEVSNLRVINADGDVVFGAGPGSMSFNVADRPWFRQLQGADAPGVVLSDVLIGRGTKTPVVIMAKGIRDPAGRFLGAAIAVMEMNTLQQRLDGLDIGSQGMVVVRRTDNRRQILRRPYIEELPANPPVVTPSLGRIAAGEKAGFGDAVSPVDGVMRRYAFEVLGGYPVMVLVGLSRTDYLENWRNQYVASAAAAFLLLAVSALLFRHRVRMSAALRRSEERYRALVDGTAAGVVLQDTHGSIVAANPTARRILRLSEESASPRESATVLRDDGTPFPADQHPTMVALATGRPVHGVMMGLRWEDGDTTWIEINADPIRHAAGGQLDGVVCSFFDVTARRAAEEALRRETHYLRLLMSSATDGIHILDEYGRLFLASESFFTMLGYTAEEGPGLIVTDWDAQLSEEELKARIPLLLHSAAVFETVHRRRDGSLLDVEVSVRGVEIEGARYLYAASRDISERKRAEAALARETAHLQALLKTASDGIHILDEEGNLVEASDSFFAMLGYDRETAPKLNVRDLDAQATPAELSANVRRQIDVPEMFETRHRRRDGSVIDVEINCHGIEIGGSVYLFASSRDITGRKQTEERLRESEARFRAVVEATTDLVWETDTTHRFTWFATTSGKVLGYEVQELVGRCPWDIASNHHHVEAMVWQQHMEDLAARMPFRGFRFWMVTGDGGERWFSMSGSPRFDDGGQFLGYRGIGTDITSEAETELRLRMLSTAVEQSPVSVVITDPDGTIVYVNERFTAVSGFSAAEAIGQNSRILASGQTPDYIYAEMWAVIGDGRKWNGDLRNRTKDGRLYWEAVMIAPVFNDERQIVYYVAIKEDITYRKEAEARIAETTQLLERQSLKLRQTNQELEQFAYVASHDLRQPLRMISSYLGLIRKRLAADLDEDLGAFFGFAMDGAKRMDQLILDLLDYSRTGRRTNPFEPVALSEVLAEAQLFLEVAIAEAGAEVTVAADLPTVSGDRGELVRLFQNLIGNAVKYRAKDRAPKIEVTCEEDTTEWVLSVQDNGIGIAPEDRERAFGIFQRLVGKDDFEGTGIGLAVCKKIVETHGGRIWIESEPGVGSTFKLALPKV